MDSEINAGSLIHVSDGTKLFKFDSDKKWIAKYLDLKETHLLVIESLNKESDRLYKVLYGGSEWFISSKDVTII